MYRYLGVPNTATTSDIQEAYEKLILEYHPDTNSNNAEAGMKVQISSLQ